MFPASLYPLLLIINMETVAIEAHKDDVSTIKHLVEGLTRSKWLGVVDGVHLAIKELKKPYKVKRSPYVNKPTKRSRN